MKHEFTVAIVGRPNVGKSTLYNRLTGTKHAIVDDTPGVTRDRREGKGNIGPLSFKVIDTAGLEEAENQALAFRMTQQTLQAIKHADVILFLVDGRAGITPYDTFFANEIRKQTNPIILVVNKCEGKKTFLEAYEAFALGFGDPVTLSAEHGEGMANLYEAVEPYYLAFQSKQTEEEASENEGNEDEKSPISIAIVGRPNAGKSTLVNQLLGEERVLTGPEAGITRDSIAVSWQYQGRTFRLVDTAGLRKKAQVVSKLEKLSAEDTKRAIHYAQVVVLLIDATMPLEHQDVTIAQHVISEGRALVLGINKWDLIENKSQVVEHIRKRVGDVLSQVKGIPILYLSALTGQNLATLMQAVLGVYEQWKRHIPTSQLNQWLHAAIENHPLPVNKLGRRVRIKFATQIKQRPPTIALFSTRPQDIADSYLRYLTNSFREAFDLPAVPVRLVLRKTKNPYANEE